MGAAVAWALNQGANAWLQEQLPVPRWENGHSSSGSLPMHYPKKEGVSYSGKVAALGLATIALYGVVEGTVVGLSSKASHQGRSFLSATEVAVLLPAWIFSLIMGKLYTRSAAASIALAVFLCALQPLLTTLLRKRDSFSTNIALLFLRNFAGAMLATVSFERVLQLGRAYDKRRAFAGTVYGLAFVMIYQQVMHSLGYVLLFCMG